MIRVLVRYCGWEEIDIGTRTCSDRPPMKYSTVHTYGYEYHTTPIADAASQPSSRGLPRQALDRGALEVLPGPAQVLPRSCHQEVPPGAAACSCRVQSRSCPLQPHRQPGFSVLPPPGRLRAPAQCVAVPELRQSSSKTRAQDRLWS